MLTEALVRHFEHDQKEFGTKTALYNVFWNFFYTLYTELDPEIARICCMRKGNK